MCNSYYNYCFRLFHISKRDSAYEHDFGGGLAV